MAATLRVFCLLVLFIADTAWALRSPTPVPPLPGKDIECAEIIAVVKVMSVSSTRIGKESFDVARTFVNEGVKNAKPGQVVDILCVTPDGYNRLRLVRSGSYLVYVKKSPFGAYALISLTQGWSDRTVADQEIKEVRAYLANVDKARKEAVRLYPELGDGRSKLHAEFMRRYTSFREAKYPVIEKHFEDPNWPVTLAKESADAIRQSTK